MVRPAISLALELGGWYVYTGRIEVSFRVPEKDCYFIGTMHAARATAPKMYEVCTYQYISVVLLLIGMFLCVLCVFRFWVGVFFLFHVTSGGI